MRVYIAEDSLLIRERLRDMLSEFPRIDIVGEAGDALTATREIHELHPDVVILDIRMPKGNGMGVLKKIDRNDSPPVVIMLTNYPYPRYKKKCMELGANFFFDKSTEFGKVSEVILQLNQDLDR